MRLNELLMSEMAFKTGNYFPELSKEQIQAALEYLEDAREVTKLEGGKFALLQKENFFVLIDHKNTVYGWIETNKTLLDNEPMTELVLVYILPEFRGGVSLLFLHGVKEFLGTPLLIDGAVFIKGEQLIDNIAKRQMYKVWTRDKRTGKRSEYRPGDITYNNRDVSVILEYTGEGLYRQYVPGSDHRTYFTRFGDVSSTI